MLVWCWSPRGAAAGAGGDSGGPHRPKAGVGGACAAADGGARQANGQACGCAGDCQSGFCVDGVCCNSACTETCKACNVAERARHLHVRPDRRARRARRATCAAVDRCRPVASTARATAPATAASYLAGTVCKPGTCAGAAVGDVNVCDGQGRCRAGPATICAPFNCDADDEHVRRPRCAIGHRLRQRRPVRRTAAAAPSRAAPCARRTANVQVGLLRRRGLLQRRVQGCVRDLQPGGPRAGPAGRRHRQARPPRHVRGPGAQHVRHDRRLRRHRRLRAATRPETVCVAPSCSGDRLNTAGTCNGLGTCLPPGDAELRPLPLPDSACINRCASDADCVAGQRCIKRELRQEDATASRARAAGDCVSNLLRRRRLLRRCLHRRLSELRAALRARDLHAGRRPAATTRATPARPRPRRACGTDGNCDGAGRLPPAPSRHRLRRRALREQRVHARGDVQRDRGLRRARTISCVAVRVQRHAVLRQLHRRRELLPRQRLHRQLVRHETERRVLLGPASSACSGNCAQGVCCATACTSACRSCALSGSMGVVHQRGERRARSRPQICTDKAGRAATRTASARPAPASATPGHAVPARHLPGERHDADARVDVRRRRRVRDARRRRPASRSPAASAPASRRAPRRRRLRGRPRSATMARAASSPPAPPARRGASASAAFCAQGVCCTTACDGQPACRARIVGSLGTCRAIAADGQDPTGKCTDQGAASCGTTGFCDGNGGCQLYAAGVQCAPPDLSRPGQPTSRRCPAPATAAARARRRRRNPAAPTAATA